MRTTAREALDRLFHPRDLAVAGAGRNPRSLGSRTLALLREFGFGGRLYAVNPAGEPCDEVPGFVSVRSIPGRVDACLIASPSRTVFDVLSDCRDAGVPVAQILTSGFGEAGEGGWKAEQRLLKAAGGVTRLVGPNCLGTYAPSAGLTFLKDADPRPGAVSVVSQSGGLGLDILMQASAWGLLLNKLVSIGNCVDLSPTDYLAYLASDPDTQVIGMYLEGMRDGAEFLRLLREVSRAKPVVILKGGRTELGMRSASSHTGALAVEHVVWRTALRGAGAAEADSVDDLVGLLAAFQPRVRYPTGNLMALVGNGGGATVLASDDLASVGLNLAPLAGETQLALMALEMPPGSTVGNPTDLPAGTLSRVSGETLATVLRRLLGDHHVNGLICHFNLGAFVNYDLPGELAGRLSTALQQVAETEKPVYIVLRATPAPQVEAMRRLVLEGCRALGLPCFPATILAARAMAEALRRHHGIRGAAPPNTLPPLNLDRVRRLLVSAKSRGLAALPQMAAFEVLDELGIPHPQVELATSPIEAVALAGEVGFPVALKIDSPDILHKTDVDGVRLRLTTKAEVAQAYAEIRAAALAHAPEARVTGVVVQSMAPEPVQQLICGVKRDQVFGPTVLLGLGGVAVELFRDISVRVVPLAADDPGSMWRELKGAPLLNGYRGQPVADTDAIEALIRRLADLSLNLPEVLEMDLNPVMVMPRGNGLTVVDCRILLR